MSLSYATFGIAVDEQDVVREAAPIARWMIGKPGAEVRAWIRRKGGIWKALDSDISSHTRT